MVNGSTATIVQFYLSKRNPLSGIIYVKFDLPKAGNKLKSNKIPHLKECVPIRAKNLDFMLPTKNNRYGIKVYRTHYPLVVAHALTIHKSQGGTFDYIEANFDLSTASANPSKKTPVNAGQCYTALSRGKTSEGTKLVNFHEDVIKVNARALLELARMKKEKPLNTTHPVNSLSGTILSLLNIRSWNMHFEHFLSDPAHLKCCSIFCFTETHLDGQPKVNVCVNAFLSPLNMV